MQRLGIEVDDRNGNNAILIVHCTVNGKLYGGGGNN